MIDYTFTILTAHLNTSSRVGSCNCATQNALAVCIMSSACVRTIFAWTVSVFIHLVQYKQIFNGGHMLSVMQHSINQSTMMSINASS